MPPGRDVLTLELKINFLRPGRGDRLVARGRVLRAGRTSVVSESEVFAFADGEEQLIAKLMSTLTVSISGPASRLSVRSLDDVLPVADRPASPIVGRDFGAIAARGHRAPPPRVVPGRVVEEQQALGVLAGAQLL